MAGLYGRIAKGEYGATFAFSRAIGLWLYDYILMNKTSSKNAIKKLREEKLDLAHRASSDRTISRLRENADKCILARKVIPIKSQLKKNVLQN